MSHLVSHPSVMLTRSLCALALLANAAAAQEPVPASPPSPAPVPVVVDTTPLPFQRPNGALVRPGTITYDLSSSRAGLATPLGVRTVQVQESVVAGMPGWLLTESRSGAAIATTDSLFLTRAELMPVRWSATSGRAVLGASFAHDTAFGALQSYQGRSSFTLPQAGGAFVTPAMVERIVELLPLRPGYHALATLVVVEIGAPRVQPADLVVEREESLPQGDHALECWVVTLTSGKVTERLWVTKESPRVVKSEQMFGDAVLTAVVRPDVVPLVVPVVPAPVPPVQVP